MQTSAPGPCPPPRLLVLITLMGRGSREEGYVKVTCSGAMAGRRFLRWLLCPPHHLLSRRGEQGPQSLPHGSYVVSPSVVLEIPAGV